MFKFEELRVYQESIDFVDEVYITIKSWPADERFGLTDQFRRASSSIKLNIAEGSSRSKRDFGRFIDFAKGSCYECIAILTIAQNRNYLSAEQRLSMYNLLDKIARMLSALKSSLRITNNE